MKIQFNELINKGLIFLKNGKFAQSEVCFIKALNQYPKNIEIFTYLIPVLIHQNKILDAQKFAVKYFQLSHKSETSLIYMGIIYFKLNDLKKALLYFDMALNINSENYDANVNKGVILHKKNQNQNAAQYLKKAIQINPDKPIAYVSYASICEDELNFEMAMRYLQKGITLNPKDFESIHALSLLQLSCLDFINGWENYELRWLKLNFKYRHDGIKKLSSLDDLAEKNILIWHEQGLGDTIQFSRYINLLIERGANITFEVQKPLLTFFQKQFKCLVVSNAAGNQYDYQLPLLSLPKLFNMNENNIPAIKEFFIADKEKYEFWKQELNLSKNKLNIGLAVSGNPNHLKEKRRQISLEYFNEFIDEFKIYLIQKDLGEEDLKNTNLGQEIIFLGKNHHWENFLDASAIVANMDLIVSIDTSLIHLAGSMNKKSILLLSKVADWRWSIETSDQSRWYESVRIIKQEKNNDWLSVINKLKLTIRKIYYE